MMLKKPHLRGFSMFLRKQSMLQSDKCHWFQPKTSGMSFDVRGQRVAHLVKRLKV